MKSKYFFTIIISVLNFIIMSCSPSEVTLNDEESISDYSKLEIGNYWVYDWFTVTPEGVSTYYATDSIFIEKDTIIDNKIFYIKSRTFLGKRKRRTILFDSLESSYIYPDSTLYLSLDPEIEVTKTYGLEEDPLAIGTFSLVDSTQLIDVPAGSFVCINFKGEIEPLQEDYEYGIRYNNNYYAKDVGLVLLTTLFYSSPNNLEMRLVDYGKK